MCQLGRKVWSFKDKAQFVIIINRTLKNQSNIIDYGYNMICDYGKENIGPKMYLR